MANRTYGPDDKDVVAPMIVRQDIPALPQNAMAMAKPRGLLEVVVDEQGRVVGMAVRGSIHPTYDSLLLSAARDWKYKPALLNGQPVKYRKLIQVTVKK
jgi:TonB family protein